jgi:hypothetical protein
MEKGTPIERTWICITFDGDAVVDWGDGNAQDLYSGDLIPFDDTRYSHMATDNDMDMLLRAGRIAAFDSRYVYLNNLPDRHLMLDEEHEQQALEAAKEEQEQSADDDPGS